MTKKERELLRAERKAKLLAILANHVGRQNAIGMGELYQAVFGKPWGNRINDTSDLRELIRKLRRDGTPICSSQEGYYLASGGSELEEFCEHFRQRALKSLAVVARIRKIELPELLGQLKLELQGGAEKGGKDAA